MKKFREFIAEDQSGAGYREKYFAGVPGVVLGPYDSEKEAWNDNGGDVDWIKKGSELTGKDKSRAKKKWQASG